MIDETASHDSSPLSRRGFIAVAATVGASVALQAADAAGTTAHATTTSAQVDRIVRGMSLEEKVGQLFVLAVSGQAADSADDAAATANRAAYGVATPAEVVARHKPGGIIYFAGARGNLAEPGQIARLSDALQRASVEAGGIPLLISTDQEQGGYVVRAPGTLLPGQMGLASSPTASADVRAVAAITRDELRAMGIHQAFAPVVDVASNPANPIIHVRSFGDDPARVASLAQSQIGTFQKGQGIVAAAKHFPGHGDTDTDSHTGLPAIGRSRAELERIDLPPFAAAIRASVGVIMSAHIVVPALDPSGDPATLSHAIITGVLRQELGYDGVVITDALDMAGVRQRYSDARVPVLALKAGVDQLLMPPDFPAARDGVLAAVRDGELSQERIDQSVVRILRLKQRFGMLTTVPIAGDPSSVASGAHLATAAQVTNRTITLLKDDGGLLPLPVGPRKVLVTGWGVGTTTNLAGVITAHGDTTTLLTTGISPDAAAIQNAASLAKQVDLVVVSTRNLGADTSSGQLDLVSALIASGAPVISVAVLEPYDIARTPEVGTHLLTYSYAKNALEALGRVLYGEVVPTSRLAVDIPRGDGTGVLYPRGAHVELARS
ncbi:glycoside hydrolase family 3 protein [Clavibacter sp. VKM Ac-2872]|uniref:glycoside hydrolase family 3 protein n=1 Tax=Clavibacter sp. VKM Ac-2872 TaxID=2783812 RepID=UPI00351B20AD